MEDNLKDKFSFWIQKRIAGSNIPFDVPKTEQDLGGILLEDAILAHIEWKNKWIDSLKNKQKLNPEDVCRDDLCKVGQWIYNEGSLLHNDLAEFTIFKENHALFHKCASNIVTIHSKGHFVDAFTLAKTELLDSSEKVGDSMVDLLIAIKQTNQT